MRIVRRVVAGVAVLLVAGCGAGGGSGSSDSEALHRQAARDLARWDAAVRDARTDALVPVGELTGQVGDWERDTGANNKQALMAGQVVASEPLSAAPARPVAVTWPDGTATPVTVLSASRTLEQLISTGHPAECRGCSPLRVFSPKLVRTELVTSRGTVRVPAWAFSVRGTNVRITRVAIDPRQLIRVTPPPVGSRPTPTGTLIDAATLASDGVTLTASFTGAPGPGTRPFGADYTAEAVESATAVVVIITEVPRGSGSGSGSGSDSGPVLACPAAGAERTASATLGRPLGDRVVLEAREGLPVPVTRG